MKFINYLTNISGVGIFPLISLLVFVAFFALCIAYVIKVDTKVMDEMKSIPFENENEIKK
jgi:cytochrome c oxidase cbb3-type subunit 3